MNVIALRLAACATPLLVAALLVLAPQAHSATDVSPPAAACQCG